MQINNLILEFFGLFSKIKGSLHVYRFDKKLADKMQYLAIFLKPVFDQYEWYLIADDENCHGFIGIGTLVKDTCDLAIILKEESFSETVEYIYGFIDFAASKIKTKKSIKFKIKLFQPPDLYGHQLTKQIFRGAQTQVYVYEQ